MEMKNHFILWMGCCSWVEPPRLDPEPIRLIRPILSYAATVGAEAPKLATPVQIHPFSILN